MRRIITIVACAIAVLGVEIPSVLASPAPLRQGDVLAGIGSGMIKHFDSTGNLIGILDTTSGSTHETGMCTDAVGNLYATNFSMGTMTKFDNQGTVLVYPWGGPFSILPESCLVNRSGSIYTGEVDGEELVRKFDPAGNLVDTFKPSIERRGIDWIDLADDQCAMFYTSEGSHVKRFDVCTDTQLSDFAALPTSPAYALRIRPNGEVLVAATGAVHRLDANGNLIQSYTTGSVGEGSYFFAMNLDPDGTSFWTGGFGSGRVYRIDIETGTLLTTFDTGIETSLAGLAIVGEITTGLQDSDGDGLFDVWETEGLDLDGNGEVDVDLPAMGADPNKKDIFVEVDWMEQGGLLSHTHKPKPEAIQEIVEAFSTAPVDGGAGINLHVDVGPDSTDFVTGNMWGGLARGNVLPHDDVLGNADDADALTNELNDLMTDHFGQTSRVFRYAIFVHRIGHPDFEDCTSGIALDQVLVVSLGGWPLCPLNPIGVGSVNEQAGTFMHELGHTLGLLHGGNEDVDPGDPETEVFNHKPNYLSIMSYSFQTSGLIVGGEDGHFDYSRFELPTLNETNLDEDNGISGGAPVVGFGTKHYCGPGTVRGLLLPGFKVSENANGPLDWNCNIVTDGVHQIDANDAGGDAQLLSGFDDWQNINFEVGNIGKAGDVPPLGFSSQDVSAAPIELTEVRDLQIQRISEPRVHLSKVATPATVMSGGTVTYTITMLNADAGSAEGVTIADTLPPGFSYQAGSTTGSTTDEPTIGGQTLTWGPFTVSAGATMTLAFHATASETPGIFFNKVAGSSANGIVSPSGDTAPVTVEQALILEMDIDIKPGGDPNSINCRAESEVIAVAILTTETFDATSVDHETVTFEGARETHVDKKTGDPKRHEEDVDGDGDIDLVLHFVLRDTSLTCDSTTGMLVGLTLGGLAIEGEDGIRMVR